jgi:hypothetical protein
MVPSQRVRSNKTPLHPAPWPGLACYLATRRGQRPALDPTPAMPSGTYSSGERVKAQAVLVSCAWPPEVVLWSERCQMYQTRLTGATFEHAAAARILQPSARRCPPRSRV